MIYIKLFNINQIFFNTKMKSILHSMIYWISILSILTRIRCLTRDTHVKQPNHDERVSMITVSGKEHPAFIRYSRSITRKVRQIVLNERWFVTRYRKERKCSITRTFFGIDLREQFNRAKKGRKTIKIATLYKQCCKRRRILVLE